MLQAILSGLFIIILIGGVLIAAFGYTKTHKRGVKSPIGKRSSLVIIGPIISAVALILLIFIPGGFYTVDNGQVAVVKKFGKYEGVSDPGIHFRNILTTTVEYYSLQVQQLDVNKEAYSKDLQAVNVSQVIQFTINKSDIQNINTNYGTLEILCMRIASISHEAIEEAAKKFDAKELVTRRDEFNAEIKRNIGDKLERYYITVQQTVLSNIVFTPEFEALIQKSKLAEQELERSKQEHEKELQEAEYKVKIAEQAAAERLAKAQGDADAVKAAADAEAYKITQLAEAEAEKIKITALADAEAIKTKLKELDAASPESVAYLEYLAWIEKWTGELPKTILGDGTSVLFPMG